MPDQGKAITQSITLKDRLLLLLPTTTYRAGAFLEAAGELGVEVVVGTDRRQALADQAPGKTLALDFLKPEKAVREILEFSRDRPLKAVLGVEDETTVLAAMASEALSLPHNSVASVSTTCNKYLMRRILAETRGPNPSFTVFPTDGDPGEICRGVRYPCVLKPVFLSASRGVIRANNREEFSEAFRRIVRMLKDPKTASRGGPAAKAVLVEDYIPGLEVAVEGLVVRGDLYVLALFDKPDPLEGPFFQETIYVTPSRLGRGLQDAIRDRTAEAARALELRDGPIHAELRANEAGLWIVEIAARSIGGLCSRTLRFGTGLSLEEILIRHAMGLPVSSLMLQGDGAGVMMLPVLVIFSDAISIYGSFVGVNLYGDVSFHLFFFHSNFQTFF